MHEIQLIKKLLDHLFNIKDLSDLKFFLGMEVARTKKGIALYQKKYTLDLPNCALFGSNQFLLLSTTL